MADSSTTNCSLDTFKKLNKSAVVIIPPAEVWQQIQSIRSIHDRAYKRWMPHINLLYPFLEDDQDGHCFSEAARMLSSTLAEVQQFKVTFHKNSFRGFHHGKSWTLWLKPEVNESCESSDVTDFQLTDYSAVHKGIAELQGCLEAAFPLCDDLRAISGSFTPHLSLGQFRPNEIEKFVAETRSKWEPITFAVNKVQLISRKSFEAPFEIRHSIKLHQ